MQFKILSLLFLVGFSFVGTAYADNNSTNAKPQVSTILPSYTHNEIKLTGNTTVSNLDKQVPTVSYNNYSYLYRDNDFSRALANIDLNELVKIQKQAQVSSDKEQESSWKTFKLDYNNSYTRALNNSYHIWYLGTDASITSVALSTNLSYARLHVYDNGSEVKPYVVYDIGYNYSHLNQTLKLDNQEYNSIENLHTLYANIGAGVQVADKFSVGFSIDVSKTTNTGPDKYYWKHSNPNLQENQ